MGVFDFILLLVLITTIGRVLSGRRPVRSLPEDAPRIGGAELERIRETLDEMTHRLDRLEDERDFYKELLESPERRELRAPGAEEAD